jgi:sigma-B regulation protein RsbU (phosphoserine phosphatase)
MAVLMGVVAYTYLAYRQAATDLVLERDEQLTVLSAARLQSDLSDYADLLDFLARSREMVEGGIATQAAALHASEQRLKVFDGGVALLDNRGRVRASLPHRPGLLAHDWSDRDFFQSVFGEAAMAVSDAQLISPEDPLMVVIAVPIRGEGDTFIGALAGMFRLGEPTLSSFYATIVRLRLGQSGSTYVVDGNGRIVYDSESERVGRFVTSSQVSMIAPPISVARLSQDEAGNDVVAAWAPIPGTGWTLIVEDDWSIVTSSTARYRDVLLLSFLAALLVPPVGLALLSRQSRFRLPELHRTEQDPSWLKTARNHLRPAQLPVLPGWNLVVRQHDGKSTEREFYDASILPDGRLMLAVGKIGAQGIQAALALASIRTLVRSAGQRLANALETLEQCNASLCSQPELSFGVRYLYLLIDPTTGWLEYAAAGSSPPHPRGNHVLQDGPAAGLPLGKQAEPDIEVGTLRLESNQTLVVLGPSMADGLGSDGQSFVQGVLKRVLEEPAAGLQDRAGRILDAFRTFQARSPYFTPDTTVVLLERSSPGT